MHMAEEEPIKCFNCDAEFNVNSEEYFGDVCFCPFCGSDIDTDYDEQDEDDDGVDL